MSNTMIEIRGLDTLEQLSELKRAYMSTTVAPLDDMWLYGFVPAATHYGIYDRGKLSGFFCVNAEGYLLQYYLEAPARERSLPLLRSIVTGESGIPERVHGAFASTAEPGWLSLCLEQFPRHEVHTLMYQHSGAKPPPAETPRTELVALDPGQLAEAVAFAVEAIGAPAEWLTGYFGNLIQRRELFGVWQLGALRATGECRGYDGVDRGHADLGVIVQVSARRQGLATGVLRALIGHAHRRGLKPICSTEMSNLGAQKAITRAGFYAEHRIVRFTSP